MVSGIVGLLLKDQYPGLVTVGENPPVFASNWEHYIVAKEWVQDSEGNPVLTTKAAKVKTEIWVSLSCTTNLKTSFIGHSRNNDKYIYITSICRISIDVRLDLM